MNPLALELAYADAYFWWASAGEAEPLAVLALFWEAVLLPPYQPIITPPDYGQ